MESARLNSFGNSRPRTIEDLADRALAPFLAVGDALQRRPTGRLDSAGDLVTNLTSSYLTGQDHRQLGLRSTAQAVLGTLGRSVEGATGVMNFLKTFAEEHRAGSKRYPESMRAMLGSVAQSVIAGGAATVVASAAAVLTGSVTLPIVAGATAALGVGYVVNQILDHGRQQEV